MKPKKCRSPEVGTFPNCFKPPCPPRYSGTYPKCRKPAGQPVCPLGWTGAFPNCSVGVATHKCPEGLMCEQTLPQPPSTQHSLTAFNKMGTLTNILTKLKNN